MAAKYLASTLVALAATLSIAPAQADNITFEIKNTSKYIISSFQTNEGSGWSKNWLSSDIEDNEGRELEFLRNGPCKIKVRVSWRTKGGGQEVGDPWNIDICEAHTVYFDGNKVTYD